MNLFDSIIWWFGFCPVCWVWTPHRRRYSCACEDCYWHADQRSHGPDRDDES